MGGPVGFGPRARSTLASLQGAGDALGIDCTPVADRAAVFGDALGDWARATIDGDTRRLGLTARWPGDGDAGALLGAVGARIQAAALPAYAQRPAAARFLELETIPGDVRVATAIHLVGRDGLAAELTRLAAASPFRAVAEVEGAAAPIGRSHDDGMIHRGAPDAADQWTFRFGFGAGPAELAASSRAALALMERVRVASSQRLGFERLHPVLAGAGCLLGVTAYFDQLAGVVRVTYHEPEWPLVCRAVAELTGRGDCAPAIGVFAGAFAAERASSLEISFRAEPLATARISVDT